MGIIRGSTEQLKEHATEGAPALHCRMPQARSGKQTKKLYSTDTGDCWEQRALEHGLNKIRGTGYCLSTMRKSILTASNETSSRGKVLTKEHNNVLLEQVSIT